MLQTRHLFTCKPNKLVKLRECLSPKLFIKYTFPSTHRVHKWATRAGRSVLWRHTACSGQPDTTQSSRSSGTWPGGGWWSESSSLSSSSKTSSRSCSSHWPVQTVTLGEQLEPNIQKSNKATKSRTDTTAKSKRGKDNVFMDFLTVQQSPIYIWRAVTAKYNFPSWTN